MKKTFRSSIFFMCLLISPLYAFLQNYQVPASYTFDADVVQHYKNSNGKDDKAINFYYTKNGDYMGIKEQNGNSMVIFTKDGLTIAIDDKKKSMVIIRLPNLAGLANAAAAKNASGTNGAANTSSASVKTGNTKKIAGYDALEYIVTDDKGEKAHIWYATVDFNAKQLYISGMGMSAMGMPGAPKMDNLPISSFAKTMTDPNSLMMELSSDKNPESTLTTESVNKKQTVIPTSGYKIQNMSNMSLQDMMQGKN